MDQVFIRYSVLDLYVFFTYNRVTIKDKGYIMATLTKQAKNSRFDMRMTADQRQEIERAAAIKGKSLTQWALDSLLSSARRDIEEETTTHLSQEQFEKLSAALSEPMPAATQALLQRTPIWDQ